MEWTHRRSSLGRRGWYHSRLNKPSDHVQAVSWNEGVRNRPYLIGDEQDPADEGDYGRHQQWRCLFDQRKGQRKSKDREEAAAAQIFVTQIFGVAQGTARVRQKTRSLASTHVRDTV
jgi:hypothetical protein